MPTTQYGRTKPEGIGVKLDPDGFAAFFAHERGFVVLPTGAVAIPLRRGKGGARATQYALVSHEDRHLGQFYWSLTNWQYPRRRTKTGAIVTLHREIMGCVAGDKLVVDHISRDRFDNRRENLRIVTQQQNTQNQGNRGGSSKYRGVSKNARGSWTVQHTLNGVFHYGGRFDDEEEANRVAMAWRAAHMPFSTDDAVAPYTREDAA